MKKAFSLRKTLTLLVGAVLYALLFALGSQIDATGSTALAVTGARFLCALPVAAAALFALLDVLPGLLQRRRQNKRGQRPFRFWLAWAIIFVCYVPMFLIEFPGTLCYDVQAQTFQIARNQYSAFQPLIHTLMIRACLSLYGVLQSFERCAAVYSLCQMVMMSCCFALAAASLSRMRSPRAGRIATAFFALYPAHMAFASNFTKDGLFAAFLVLFFSLLMEEMTTGRLEAKHRTMMIVSGALACLFRNNMLYALAVFFLLLLPFVGRHWKTVLCCALVAALGFGGNLLLRTALNADSGSKIEMLSVPIQQLARARIYADDRFTQEEREMMDELFAPANYRLYEPTLSDPVKNYVPQASVLERGDEAFALWLSVGKKCPDIYLDAFLNLMHSALYPYSEYRVAQPYIETGKQPGALTAPFGQEPIVQPSRFEAAREWVYKNIYETGMDGVPVMRLLFNCGAIYWLCLLCVLRALYSGCWNRFGAMLLPVMLYGTYLLGPVMQGRYLYPFVCAVPVLLAGYADAQQ